MSSPRPLAALRDATVTFGGLPTFEKISMGVAYGERVCLVGRNGSGKSTLLKALGGLIALDDGERFVQPGARLSYMPQEPVFDPEMTAASYVAMGLPDEENLVTSRHKVEAALEETGMDPDRVLTGLSGGEARRVSLAQAFVGEPDILLLDEPTNHLDIPAIEWLEAKLSAYRGAVVMISHDRALLIRLARRVLWLDRGTMRVMNDGFAAFDDWSEGILEAEAAEQVRLDKKIASETLWMRQGISARRTRNMGRVRALQQLRREKAEQIDTRSAKLGEAVASETIGRLAIECEHIFKSFIAQDGAAATIIRDFSTRVMKGNRVGVVGPNGAGKSTLLRLLTGADEPDQGRINRSRNLVPAYFDQHRLGLNGERSVRDNLADGGDTVFVRGQARHVMGYLRDFLFDENQARTPVKRLSGGERNRLLLAKILAQPSNLLVLDEPTNDLDMETLDLLEDLLAEYDGTLLLVSHDRDFLDRLVTSVIAVEGGGEVAEYVGGWTDYVRQRPVQEKGPVAVSKSAPKPGPSAASRQRFGFKEQRDLETASKAIETLTVEKSTLEKTIADVTLFERDRAAFDIAMRRLEMVTGELEMAEERWLDLEMKRADLER